MKAKKKKKRKKERQKQETRNPWTTIERHSEIKFLSN